MSYPAFRGTRARGQQPSFTPPAKETEFSTRRIDWFAVERAINGEAPRPTLTPEETREAALWLRQHGMSRATISVHLCVYERLVREWEAEAGLLGPEDLCTRDDCQRARAARGLCAIHYQAARFQEKQWQIALAELGTAA